MRALYDVKNDLLGRLSRSLVELSDELVYLQRELDLGWVVRPCCCEHGPQVLKLDIPLVRILMPGQVHKSRTSRG